MTKSKYTTKYDLNAPFSLICYSVVSFFLSFSVSFLLFFDEFVLFFFFVFYFVGDNNKIKKVKNVKYPKQRKLSPFSFILLPFQIGETFRKTCDFVFVFFFLIVWCGFGSVLLLLLLIDQTNSKLNGFYNKKKKKIERKIEMCANARLTIKFFFIIYSDLQQMFTRERRKKKWNEKKT